MILVELAKFDIGGIGKVYGNLLQVPDTATAGPLEVQLCDRLLVNRVGEKDARTPKSKMAKILLVEKRIWLS